MIKMETVSKEELSSMKMLASDIKHIESEIYLKGNQVYKIFHGYDDDMDGYVMNKKRKLSYLLTHESLPGVISPNALLQDENGLFCGYRMDFFLNAKTLDKVVNEKESTALSILKDISRKLKVLHEKDTLVVDFTTNNILYNEEDNRYCDVDSMVIHNYPSEIYPMLLFYNFSVHKEYPYPLSFKEPNKIYTKSSDIFEINYLILSILFNKKIYELDKDDYLEYLKTLELPSEVYSVFSHLQDVFYEQEEGIYPHEYLDYLSEFKFNNERKLQRIK